MECGNKLRTFILNSNGRKSVASGECFDLSDIFYNIYLKQSNTNWNFRDILNISKNDDKNYTIKLKNLKSRSKNTISDNQATDGIYDGGVFISYTINQSDFYAEFYWNLKDTNVITRERGYSEDKEGSFDRLYLKDGTIIMITSM